MNMKDKVCIVIGLVGGIGYVIVKCYVVEGVKVVIVDFKVDVVEKVVFELKVIGFGDVFVVEMDVMSEDVVNVGVVVMIEKWGCVDVFVLNVGI